MVEGRLCALESASGAVWQQSRIPGGVHLRIKLHFNNSTPNESNWAEEEEEEEVWPEADVHDFHKGCWQKVQKGKEGGGVYEELP